MKQKLFIFLVATLTTMSICSAQDFSRLTKSEKTGLVTISKIIECQGKTKEEIYTKTKLWIAQTYSTKEVIQLDDKDGGIIVIKATEIVNQIYVNYTMTIKIKDGKIKLDTDNIFSDSCVPVPGYGWGYAEEWIEGKANGHQQPKGSLKKLTSLANGTVDGIENVYKNLETAINQSSVTEEDW